MSKTTTKFCRYKSYASVLLWDSYWFRWIHSCSLLEHVFFPSHLKDRILNPPTWDKGELWADSAKLWFTHTILSQSNSKSYTFTVTSHQKCLKRKERKGRKYRGYINSHTVFVGNQLRCFWIFHLNSNVPNAHFFGSWKSEMANQILLHAFTIFLTKNIIDTLSHKIWNKNDCYSALKQDPNT